ncbi:MAG: HepT-like ribonuclease domain-containing protein [candidate division NC10 bacterium]
MNPEPSTIFERLQAQAEDLLAETPTLFAYGIAVPDGFPALHEVQLAVYMDPSLPPESYFHVEIRLEALLEETLAIPVAGARILNSTPLTLQGAVLTAGRVIYSRDEGARIAFEQQVWRRYFDFRQMLVCDQRTTVEGAVMNRKEEVAARLRQMEEYIGHVRELEETASEGPIKGGAGRYFLQSAVTCCLVICLELIAALKLRPPRDLTDVPEVLAEVSLVGGDLARELARLIAIRDQLVHDPDTAETPLGQGHLGSLERFAQAVRERIEM